MIRVSLGEAEHGRRTLMGKGRCPIALMSWEANETFFP